VFVRGSRFAGERADTNGTGALPNDELGRLRIGRNPWTETLDVAAGCNKPAQPEAEKAVERLRKPEGGMYREMDCFREGGRRR
jgi:hypothetical protein